MIKKTLPIFCLLLVLGLSGCQSLSSQQPAQAQPPVPQQVWEKYEPNFLQRLLNFLSEKPEELTK